MIRRPDGLVGIPLATISSTVVNGIPNPMVGISVSQQLFGLNQVLAYENATGIKTNAMMFYQDLITGFPSTWDSVVATGRHIMMTIQPHTGQLVVSGGVRNSDSAVDSPMVAGTVYKGVVISSVTILASSATQPAGTYLQLGPVGSSIICTTQAPITTGTTGQILTSTFTATATQASSSLSCLTADLAGVTSGTYDAQLGQWARFAGGNGSVRFAHEMNGAWYCWGIGSGGSGFTGAQYQAMWNHVRTIWRAQETTHMPWVWSPNVTGGSLAFSTAYPGDSACEYVALDGYATPNNSYASFQTLFDADLTTLGSLSTRPQLIGEFGISAMAPNRPTWLTAGFTYLKTRPNVKGFNYFEHQDTYVDYIENDINACTAYRNGVLSWAP